MSNILKCKMCGGDISINKDMTVATCLYCGSLMTIPRIDSDKKARLFNRANDYRLNNEFDKAYDAYKAISEEDEQEAEAYWGMLLAEYGVEYVEDPKSKKRIPTCHRTCIKSIKNTTNFSMACQYADAENLMMYQDEAEEIDRIQKKILSVSTKEEPYDVFICYKETDDASGERTKDSVLAYEIYEDLEKRGIRTFFSRVSLEDKLGTDYEPYIYSALKSARVLLLVTTSSEYAQSVWVKNEWRRYLSFIEEGEDKTLIPVFRDISLYELPSELSRFQSLDLAKVGAQQDLLRSIEKILGSSGNNSAIANDVIIKKLVEEKQQQELRKERFKKMSVPILQMAILSFSVVFTLLSKTFFENEKVVFTIKSFFQRFTFMAIIYGITVGIAVLLTIAAIIYGYKYGIEKKMFLTSAVTSQVFHLAAVLYISFHHFRAGSAILPLICNAFLLLLSIITCAREYKKKQLIIFGLLALISVMISIPFYTMKLKNEGFEFNALEDQVKIDFNHMDIRKRPSKKGVKIAEGYPKQYFKVTDIVVDDDYHRWYKISTATNMKGYVSALEVTYHRNYVDCILDAISNRDIHEAKAYLQLLSSDNYTDEMIEGLEEWITEYIDMGEPQNAQELYEYLPNKDKLLKSEIDSAIQKAADEEKRALEDAEKQKKYDDASTKAQEVSITSKSEALKAFSDLRKEGYRDSYDKYKEVADEIYQEAMKEMDNQNYKKAKEIFQILNKYSYSDSSDQVRKCNQLIEEEEQAYYEKVAKINGTWKSSNFFEQEVRFTVGDKGTIYWYHYADPTWYSNGKVTYNEDTDEYHLSWNTNSFTAVVNGNSMTITSDQGDDNMFFPGKYKKISDE